MCGVFGIVSFTGANVTPIILEKLAHMQHRGQDSVGLATVHSRKREPARYWKELGSPHKWFNRETGGILVRDLIQRLHGDIGIGHLRYATASLRNQRNAQPHYFDHGGRNLILASNGDIPFCAKERERLKRRGHLFASRCDAEVIVKLIGRHLQENDSSEEEAFGHVGRTLSAAFSLVSLVPSKRLFVMRDQFGIRPLWWAQDAHGVYFCSESALIEEWGEPHEVLAGSLMVATPQGSITTHRFAPAAYRRCLMEYFYFSRPDSLCDEELGLLISEVRYQLGQRLVEELIERQVPCPDLIIPVPYSGNDAAEGCATGFKARFRSAIIKDRFSERVFQLDELERSRMVRRRFRINRQAVRDKVVLLVDDSIVRGDQGTFLTKVLREAGVRQVFYASTAPAFRFPCFLGINTPNPKKLFAHGRTEEEVRQALGVDLLHYLSMAGTCKVLGRDEQHFCSGCFTGEYPMPVPIGRSEV